MSYQFRKRAASETLAQAGREDSIKSRTGLPVECDKEFFEQVGFRKSEGNLPHVLVAGGMRENDNDLVMIHQFCQFPANLLAGKGHRLIKRQFPNKSPKVLLFRTASNYR